MSLFANENYRWRETYFVLFRRENRPSVDQLKETLQGFGGGYEVSEIQLTEEGNLEALISSIKLFRKKAIEGNSH